MKIYILQSVLYKNSYFNFTFSKYTFTDFNTFVKYKMISNSALSDFLIKKSTSRGSFIDKIKISYRPYICPFNELLELIPKEKNIFDIGCGSGMFLSLAAEYCYPSAIGGVEINDRLVQNAIDIIETSGYQGNIFLQKYDGNILPEEIREYDYIFMIDVLHHIPVIQHEAFLSALFSKMKNGARLILKDINAARPLLTLCNKMHDLILSGEIGNEISLEKCKLILSKAGFTIIHDTQKRMLWYPHYTIITEKK